jgi:amino-acid N-acetyltransferase
MQQSQSTPSYTTQAPAVSVIRRHTRSSNTSDEFHFAPALRVVSGNYVTSKRRGVVDGVDFGSTGSVRFVQHEAIHQQLDLGHLVLLSNLGYSASGEVLNCNTFDVATHAAIELKADKIMCITMDDVKSLNMPQWLSLGDAEALISERLAGVGSDIACSIDETCPSLDGTAAGAMNSATPPVYSNNGNGSSPPDQAYLVNGSSNGAMGSVRHQTLAEVELDMDCWQALNFPNAILTAVVGCKSGVKRAHLVDARQDGGLLLELYSRCAHHCCTLIPSCLVFLPDCRQRCHRDSPALHYQSQRSIIDAHLHLLCISPYPRTTSSKYAVHIQLDALSSSKIAQTFFTIGSSHT